MARKELWEQVDSDLYLVLGISPDATPEQIQVAWREAAKRTHPDRGGSVAEFQQAEIAYQVLSDPLERSRYDRIAAVPTGATSSQRQAPPTWTYQPPRGNPYGPSFASAQARYQQARYQAESPYLDDSVVNRKVNGWMVAMIILGIILAIVLLVATAVFAIVVVVAGLAAWLGSALRGKQHE